MRGAIRRIDCISMPRLTALSSSSLHASSGTRWLLCFPSTWTDMKLNGPAIRSSARHTVSSHHRTPLFQIYSAAFAGATGWYLPMPPSSQLRNLGQYLHSFCFIFSASLWCHMQSLHRYSPSLHVLGSSCRCRLSPSSIHGYPHQPPCNEP